MKGAVFTGREIRELTAEIAPGSALFIQVPLGKTRPDFQRAVSSSFVKNGLGRMTLITADLFCPPRVLISGLLIAHRDCGPDLKTIKAPQFNVSSAERDTTATAYVIFLGRVQPMSKDPEKGDKR